MITVRSPLRLPLGGGGTDLMSYSQRFGGELITAAIDQFVEVSVDRTSSGVCELRLPELQMVTGLDEITHPIARESLRLTATDLRGLAISSRSDVAAGTGLGSSGAFTVALLQALSLLGGRALDPIKLAALASHLEIDVLGEPVGKQDHYITATGGLRWFRFCEDGLVRSREVALDPATRLELETRLLLFDTGRTRRAATVLREQDDRTRSGDEEMIENLHQVKDIARRTLQTLESGDLDPLGKLLDEHWQIKRHRSSIMTSAPIDSWYELALRNGADGGKLVGAGGGGFLLLCTTEPDRLRAALAATGLEELRWRFEDRGTHVVDGP